MASTRKTKRNVVLMYGEPDRFSPLLDGEPEAAAAPVTVKTKVWRWKQGAAWHFATVPKAQSAQIRSKVTGAKRGWGSVPLRIRVGETEWETSLFPEGKAGTYLFAIKASVRKAEGIEEGNTITAQVFLRT
ncbi:DUF1905 domain-containing protein [Solimonas sp. SE-A11]|uniref:DUF1905 domain-containing protein n=1 Tax=Solimonas sp. SE-A11 TaxID=3054954 RepID=UPI00259CB085|nr:DUF1905 domain-containing protein [Solimonas sp. SE-A11]MDM4769028.1 DUF1905 domain-containing protein [Solimonas sp. SE-A11]